MCSILIPKILCALCFIMFFLSFFAAFFMKALWPKRFGNIDNKMTTQNASDLLIWVSLLFWFTMWGFRTMFDGW